MKKRIHIPRKMAGFNDLYWVLSYKLPGNTRGCAFIALFLTGLAIFMPFLQLGDKQITGYDYFQTGWQSIKMGHFAYKTLFVSWISTIYLIFSMLTIRSHNPAAKPELVSVMFGFALASLYVLTTYPYRPEDGTLTASLLPGSYVWVSAFFMATLSHAKSVYSQ